MEPRRGWARPRFPGLHRIDLVQYNGSPSPESQSSAVSQRLVPNKSAEIGRIASKYVRVSLPAPQLTSPHSPALTADKAEVATEQARPPRLDLSTPPLHPTAIPHQQPKTRFPAEPAPDKVEGDRDSRKHRITTPAAEMNHHHTQQQKAGEQQLSEPEDMEMEDRPHISCIRFGYRISHAVQFSPPTLRDVRQSWKVKVGGAVSQAHTGGSGAGICCFIVWKTKRLGALAIFNDLFLLDRFAVRDELMKPVGTISDT
ncbi:hypothetical protein XENOCAPTIV_017779 [Xenoophorus captivus]|uniref:Uncharacterized protein n=1 Tax=Xenoophorus captivus TaxID=1517983 RepID=A0ABV0SBJ6_9TELE